MDATPFELHPRLAADTHFIRDLELSRVLLMDDLRFAWLILVPTRAGMRDWIDLALAEQHRLLDEIGLCSHALRALVQPDKLNVAALGNVVPQLHVHVIARCRGDPAWPKPVWGAAPARDYDPTTREPLVAALRRELWPEK